MTEEEAREKKEKKNLNTIKHANGQGVIKTITLHILFLLFIYSLFLIITAQCSQNILYLNKEHEHPYQFITV